MYIFIINWHTYRDTFMAVSNTDNFNNFQNHGSWAKDSSHKKHQDMCGTVITMPYSNSAHVKTPSLASPQYFSRLLSTRSLHSSLHATLSSQSSMLPLWWGMNQDYFKCQKIPNGRNVSEDKKWAKSTKYWHKVGLHSHSGPGYCSFFFTSSEPESAGM